MDTKKKKQKVTEGIEDIEVPTLDDAIQNWCEVPTENDNKKSADDLVIDDWCKDSEDKSEKKKEKEQ